MQLYPAPDLSDPLFFDKAVLEIDLGAVSSNYQKIRSHIPSSSRIAAMVKANAYGVGVEHIVPILEKKGCDLYIVANLSEAIDVRRFTQHEILVLSGYCPQHDAVYQQYNLIPIINALKQVVDIKSKNIKHAWHIDTGMNRLGVSMAHWPMLLETGIVPHMILSHMVSADDPADPINAVQKQIFRSIFEDFKRVHPHAKTTFSLGNSASIFEYPQSYYDIVRPGMALYGLNPNNTPMHPVVSLYAPILQIRDAQMGESVGYNATYRVTQPQRLATIALGYADGFLRSASNKAILYWQGQPCPVVGRVSMDLVTIALPSAAAACKTGDMIEIIGAHQTIEALASSMNTINYELLTGLCGGMSGRFQKNIIV
jgi:alanine racemase